MDNIVKVFNEYTDQLEYLQECYSFLLVNCVNGESEKEVLDYYYHKAFDRILTNFENKMN